MKLNELTIVEAQDKLKAGEITSVDLTKACLQRIKEVDGKIKACLTVCADEAIRQAEEADRRRKNGENTPLLGIPYIAKDNIMTAGIKTTAASKILENYIAPFDATIIKKIKEAGAVLLAKSNLDEFAHGVSTENSAFITTSNPWDLSRVPGGSSGGSAAAVAADMCLFALGTDTGGSIRCPAGFCGVTGLKPSYGRSSRFGLIAMTSSTDVPGPLTKTVFDSSVVLSVIAGQDENDATTPDEPIPNYSEEIKSDLKGLKIGLDEACFVEGVEQDIIDSVKAVAEKFGELGAEIVPIKLKYNLYGLPVYYIITPSEISSNLARFDGIRFGLSEEGETLAELYKNTRGQGFGPEVKRRIMLGTYALSAGYYDAYYLKAQKVRTKIKEEFDNELEKVDAIITPTSPHIAFKIGEQSDDPLQMYLEDIFMSGVSLSGLAAISIPGGFSQGMPVGFQLIAKRFNESLLFRLGHHYQQNTDWHKQKPEIK